MPRQVINQVCQELRKSFYHVPLPTKKQRVVHCRERSGPLNQWTSEQIFLENLKQFKTREPKLSFSTH